MLEIADCGGENDKGKKYRYITTRRSRKDKKKINFDVSIVSLEACPSLDSILESL